MAITFGASYKKVHRVFAGWRHAVRQRPARPDNVAMKAYESGVLLGTDPRFVDTCAATAFLAAIDESPLHVAW